MRHVDHLVVGRLLSKQAVATHFFVFGTRHVTAALASIATSKREDEQRRQKDQKVGDRRACMPAAAAHVLRLRSVWTTTTAHEDTQYQPVPAEQEAQPRPC